MIRAFLTNQVFLSVIIASAVCELWKFIDSSARNKKLEWMAFLSTGGMPSSHSTFVCSIAVSIGIVEGWASTVFLLSLGFATIVVRDALGVRRAVDDLAHTINEVIRTKKLGIAEFLKITGHTPVQVFVGCLVGIIIPILLHIFVWI